MPPSNPPPPYKIILQPPPGPVVAPNGSAVPFSAPKPFLDARKIRVEVFCEEQNCALENELDEDDPKSWSWILYEPSKKEEQGEGEEEYIPVSTIRLVPPPYLSHSDHISDGNDHPKPSTVVDEQEEAYVKLSRVATLASARGKGYSKFLIKHAFEWLREHVDQVPEQGNGKRWNGLILTHAQVDVEGLYKKLGFVTDESMGRWFEEGILHVGMWKRIEL